MPTISLLNSPAERQRRRSLLSKPHIKPLCDYLDVLRADDPDIPNFDPCDGGINARALFLFEAPHTTVESGFISRENPDRTAANCRALFAAAGLDRQETILWNVVPWRVEKHIDESDVRRALPLLKDLLNLLPDLEVIVLLGQKSWIAHKPLATITRAIIKETWMPSATCFNVHKKQPEVQRTFNEVAQIVVQSKRSA